MSNFKQTLLPEQIIFNDQVQPELSDSAPGIETLASFPHYPINKTTLKNGLTVYLIKPQSTINTTALFALIFTKNERYSPVMNDLVLQWNSASFLTNKNRKITTRISIIAENSGATIKSFSLNKVTGWYLQALPEKAENILYLLSQLVTGLNYSDEELQLAKQKLAVTKRADSVSGHNLTWQLFKKITLPQDLSNLTTPNPEKYRQLRRDITLLNLKNFVENSLIPAKASLIIISAQPRQTILPLIEKYFSHWASKINPNTATLPGTLKPKDSFIQQPQKFFAVERTGSTQVDLRTAFWPENYSSAQIQSLKVLRELLAGSGLASRMTNDLREKKGLTYFISAPLNKFANLQSLQFVSSTEPYKLPALLQGMQQHIQAALNTGITKKEFTALKTRLMIKYQRKLLTDFQKLLQLIKIIGDRNNTADLSAESQALASLRYEQFQQTLARLQSVPLITLLAGDKKAITHHLCEYYTKCKIIWYNKDLN